MTSLVKVSICDQISFDQIHVYNAKVLITGLQDRKVVQAGLLLYSRLEKNHLDAKNIEEWISYNVFDVYKNGMKFSHLSCH